MKISKKRDGVYIVDGEEYVYSEYDNTLANENEVLLPGSIETANQSEDDPSIILTIDEIAEELMEGENQRKGQAYFNALMQVCPSLAGRLRGGPTDPFYRDELVDAFVCDITLKVTPDELIEFQNKIKEV